MSYGSVWSMLVTLYQCFTLGKVKIKILVSLWELNLWSVLLNLSDFELFLYAYSIYTHEILFKIGFIYAPWAPFLNLGWFFNSLKMCINFTFKNIQSDKILKIIWARQVGYLFHSKRVSLYSWANSGHPSGLTLLQ